MIPINLVIIETSKCIPFQVEEVQFAGSPDVDAKMWSQNAIQVKILRGHWPYSTSDIHRPWPCRSSKSPRRKQGGTHHVGMDVRLLSCAGRSKATGPAANLFIDCQMNQESRCIMLYQCTKWYKMHKMHPVHTHSLSQFQHENLLSTRSGLRL